MDPFELTKDPDGGGMTVRVKHGFVVLTREEERRVIERIAEMRDENARLREQVTQIRDDWESERDYADQMEAKEKRAVAENNMLRELCDDFYKCLDTALYLAKDAGYPVMPDQKLFDSLYPRMRELGVEVPDV